jgi:hypothetical protein
MYRKSILWFVALAMCSLMACSGPGYRGLVNSAISTASGRAEMLTKVVNDFHQSLYWGEIDIASSFVAETSRYAFQKYTQESLRSQKFVDITVDTVNLTDDNYKADVEATIRYYKIPQYQIKVRRELQKWEFDRLGGGWFVNEIKDIKENEGADLAAEEIPLDEKM